MLRVSSLLGRASMALTINLEIVSQMLTVLQEMVTLTEV